MPIIEKLFNELSVNSRKSLENIVEIIKEKDNILITGHATPDGDALASTFALGYICKALNKKFILYNESQVPDFLEFLPKPQEMVHDLDTLPFNPDLTIILDCGDRKRIGKQGDRLLKLAPSMNIDHHLNNPNFASLANWADSTMASTGNAVAFIALSLDIPLSGNLGLCIYTTIVTDTGSFAFSNSNTRSFLTASLIVENGLDPSTISSALNNQWSDNKMHLWSYLYANYIKDDILPIAYVLVPKALLEEYQCTKEDLEGFVDQLRKIRGTAISFIVREEGAEECRASFRSQGDDDVQKLCQYLNGGGHKNASGATIRLPLSAARNIILETLQNHEDQILAKR